MPKSPFTYGNLDERLCGLGFTARTQKGKARIYRHKKTGASIILPDVAFSEEVLLHHLAVVRHVLNEHNIADQNGKPIISSKACNQFPQAG